MNEKVMRLMNQNKRDLATCKERLEQAAYLYKAGKEAEANEILQEISVLGSKITIRQREMLMESGVPTAREDVEKIIAERILWKLGLPRKAGLESIWSRWPKPRILRPRNIFAGSSILLCGDSSQTRQLFAILIAR